MGMGMDIWYGCMDMYGYGGYWDVLELDGGAWGIGEGMGAWGKGVLWGVMEVLNRKALIHPYARTLIMKSRARAWDTEGSRGCRSTLVSVCVCIYVYMGWGRCLYRVYGYI